MKTKNYLLIAFLLFSIFCYGQGQLNELIESAIKNNRYEDVFFLENEKLKEEKRISKNILPNFSFDISDQTNLGRSFDQISGTMNPREEWFNSSSVSLKFQYGFSSILASKTTSNLLQEKLNLIELISLDKKQKLIFTIVEYYYEALFYQEMINQGLFHQKQLQILEKDIQELYANYKIGDLEVLSNKRELVALEQNIFLFNEKKNENINKIEYYTLEKFAIRENDIEIMVSEKFVKGNSLSMIEVQLNEVHNNIDSLTIKAELIKKYSNIELYSSLGTYYSSRMKGEAFFLNQLNINSFFSVGVRFNIPIFSLIDKSRYKISSLNHEITRKQREVENSRYMIYYKGLIENYNFIIDTYESMNEKKDIVNKMYALNKILFDHNKITFKNLLDSYKDVKSIESEVISMKYILLKKRFVLNYLCSLKI